jgi:hypothetical protein
VKVSGDMRSQLDIYQQHTESMTAPASTIDEWGLSTDSRLTLSCLKQITLQKII